MDEKAINLRREVWFNPPKLPKIIENIIININKLKLIKYLTIIKGAIFCQVISKIIEFHFNPSRTVGNQKWKGAPPIFSNIDEEIKIDK